MSVEDRIEATAKNIEGKLQEAVGEMTGNPADKAKGQAKQMQAKMMQTKENIKDAIDKKLD